jgi:hypothetical protein
VIRERGLLPHRSHGYIPQLSLHAQTLLTPGFMKP